MTASLDAIVGALEGTRSGRAWRCRCPVHNGRSLIVEARAGVVLFDCKQGCAKGAVIDALKELGVWPSSEGRDHHLHQVRRASAPNIFQKPEDAKGTLAERGILPETQRRFGLSEDVSLIRFPIPTPDGQTDGVKARRKHPQGDEGRYFWASPTSSALYCHWPTVHEYAGHRDGGGFVYLVEGMMDVLSLTQAGCPAMAPVHGSGKYPEAVTAMVATLIEDGLGLVFLFAQNDLPGLKFADGWRERLRGLWPDDPTPAPYSSHVSVTVTPREVDGVRVKDPADVLQVLGPERFRVWLAKKSAGYHWQSPILQPVEWTLR